jgi:hypothetical protein
VRDNNIEALGLHPSWAAKKALADQATLLAKPQGTKIRFDEE